MTTTPERRFGPPIEVKSAVFVASHSREVRHATCYIPVEFLSVTSVMELPGVCLLPVDDPQVPPSARWFVLEKPTGCVAAVEVEGSSFARMANRARDRVNHLLRVIRIAQSAHVPDFQLRFRIGIGYAFDDRLHGWDRRDDEAYELMLTGQDVTELAGFPRADLTGLTWACGHGGVAIDGSVA